MQNDLYILATAIRFLSDIMIFPMQILSFPPPYVSLVPLEVIDAFLLAILLSTAGFLRPSQRGLRSSRP